MNNVLLQEWKTPFQIAPFNSISDDDFTPALDEALARHKAEVAAITEQTEQPDFTNTIEALEATGYDLNRVLGVFFTMAGADSNPVREALQRNFSPKLAAHFSDISGNTALFQRILCVWSKRDDLNLTAEQSRILMLTHRGFVRSGAGLKDTSKNRMKAIKERLAELGTQFSQNLLADEQEWFIKLAKEDLAGLPSFVINAALAAGEEKNAGGPIINLSRSLIVPFLQFSTRRNLRKKAYNAWVKRGANTGKTDNRAIAAKILELRAEQADLLGYKSFAEYKLETEMAKTPKAVRDLLLSVWKPAKARAEADGAVLESMMQADGLTGSLEAWDWRFYSERRRKDLHELDEAKLKPYFQLNRMIEASFSCANRLFDLKFEPITLPLYHQDCRAWSVTRDGKHLAIFIADYFARGSKRSGAWCSAMRSQAKFPTIQTPIIINVCNFAKGDPTFLSYDDACTLFHEFGHALHQILSNVTYESVSGTSVARDFVELPSQLYEHWLTVPEVLKEFATHAETNQPMPPELLNNLLAATNYDMGFQTVEYVASAIIDLAFHDGEAPADPMALETEILKDIGMPHAIRMRHATPNFAHIFAGDGYASGYYSYMWSEMMDEDAFAAFEEANDAFDQDNATALEQNILSRGGSADAEDLYIAFRGHLPDVKALLKGRNLKF